MKSEKGEMERAAGAKKTIYLGAKRVPMELAWCPPGTFTMGSDNRGNDEKPAHLVTITRGFWMARTPVTEAQWKAVMGTTLLKQMYKEMPSWVKPTIWRGRRYPMNYVNWEEANAFCAKAGKGLRLPTEAEWEYACRAGGTGDYGKPPPGKSGKPEDMGWFWKKVRIREWLADRIMYWAIPKGPTWWLFRWRNEFLLPNPHPVGKKTPNAWGLFDMHGNVQEWCADWYAREYYAKSPAVDPQGPPVPEDKFKERVCRGGGCFACTEDGDGRSASRQGKSHHHRNSVIGFRPVAWQT